MNARNVMIPLGLLALLYLAYDSLGWKGVAAVGGGILMWLLLHFTRLMTVMPRGGAPHRLCRQRRDAQRQAQAQGQPDACGGPDPLAG